MQWTGDRNAGFSNADPSRLYAPVIHDPIYHYQAINAESQQRTPTSLLNWLRRVIRIRKQFSGFGRGALDFVPCPNPKILAYLRRSEDGNVLVVNNLSRFAQPAELDLRAWAGMTPVEMFGGTPFPPIGDRPYLLTPGPHTFYWLRLVPTSDLPAQGA
jgi:maltose alpha-D-glucosyltransferase/alpha-amylase